MFNDVWFNFRNNIFCSNKDVVSATEGSYSTVQVSAVPKVITKHPKPFKGARPDHTYSKPRSCESSSSADEGVADVHKPTYQQASSKPVVMTTSVKVNVTSSNVIRDSPSDTSVNTGTNTQAEKMEVDEIVRSKMADICPVSLSQLESEKLIEKSAVPKNSEQKTNDGSYQSSFVSKSSASQDKTNSSKEKNYNLNIIDMDELSESDMSGADANSTAGEETAESQMSVVDSSSTAGYDTADSQDEKQDDHVALSRMESAPFIPMDTGELEKTCRFDVRDEIVSVCDPKLPLGGLKGENQARTESPYGTSSESSGTTKVSFFISSSELTSDADNSPNPVMVSDQSKGVKAESKLENKKQGMKTSDTQTDKGEVQSDHVKEDVNKTVEEILNVTVMKQEVEKLVNEMIIETVRSYDVKEFLEDIISVTVSEADTMYTRQVLDELVTEVSSNMDKNIIKEILDDILLKVDELIEKNKTKACQVTKNDTPTLSNSTSDLKVEDNLKDTCGMAEDIDKPDMKQSVTNLRKLIPYSESSQSDSECESPESIVMAEESVVNSPNPSEASIKENKDFLDIIDSEKNNIEREIEVSGVESNTDHLNDKDTMEAPKKSTMETDSQGNSLEQKLKSDKLPDVTDVNFPDLDSMGVSVEELSVFGDNLNLNMFENISSADSEEEMPKLEDADPAPKLEKIEGTCTGNLHVDTDLMPDLESERLRKFCSPKSDTSSTAMPELTPTSTVSDKPKEKSIEKVEPDKSDKELQEKDKKEPVNINLDGEALKAEASTMVNTTKAIEKECKHKSQLPEDPKEKERILIQMCMDGLKICLTRFPHHYKSLYRMAYVYFKAEHFKVRTFCFHAKLLKQIKL